MTETPSSYTDHTKLPIQELPPSAPSSVVDKQKMREARRRATTWDIVSKDVSDLYTNVAAIGVGSFGIVYRAERDSVKVALKFFMGTQDDSLNYAIREVKYLIYLKLQNNDVCRDDVVCYFNHFLAKYGELERELVFNDHKYKRWVEAGDLNTAGETQFPVIETRFIKGLTFLQIIETKTSDGITFQKQLRLLKAAAQALIWMHSNGVFHGDIKPANLMAINLGTDVAETVLLDLGGSCSLDLKSDDTHCTVKPIATLHYRAPEARGQSKQQPHTNAHLQAGIDIYALGISFYHMLTGNDHTPASKVIGPFPPNLKHTGALLSWMTNVNWTDRTSLSKVLEEVDHIAGRLNLQI